MKFILHIVAALTALSAVLLADSPSDRDVVRQKACAALHAHDGRFTDVPELQEQLVALGSAAIPTLFAILAEGEVPPSDGRRTKRLTPTSELALVMALEQLPRQPLRFVLGQVAARPVDQEARLEGLRLLARFGEPEDLRLATRLAVHDEGSPPKLRSAFAKSVEQILRRRPRGIDHPALDFAGLEPVLHHDTAFAIGSLETRAAFKTLARNLGRSASADAILLLELRRLVRTLKVPPDSRDVGEIRRTLASSDPTVVILAAGILGDLRDAAAMPELIAALSADDPNEERAVHSALAAIAHLDLGTRVDRWSSWYDLQAAWLEKSGDATARAVVDGTVQAALAAIADVAARHALRDAAVELLLPGLRRSEPILVERTATALGHLGSWRAVPALLDALDAEAESTRSAACTALQRITTLHLPPDAVAWRSSLQFLEEAQ